jgi:putative addiction module component (TIGR02574 family)
MIAKEEVQKLAIEEKLQVMEWLWEDLARDEDAVPVPEWHRAVLDKRRQFVQEGKGKFVSWEQVKQDLKIPSE